MKLPPENQRYPHHGIIEISLIPMMIIQIWIQNDEIKYWYEMETENGENICNYTRWRRG